MIRLDWKTPNNVADIRTLTQTAIDVEFGTLPPYLYALMSIKQGHNKDAFDRIMSIVMQEMVHMCLACNILNAIGGSPKINPPSYPGPLPGDIGSDGKILTIHLLPFSEDAMHQGMKIEQPVKPVIIPEAHAALKSALTGPVTIGEFYHYLDVHLSQLPASDWSANRNQIDDSQFFQGQVFAVNNYAQARRAIARIVSEGEGAEDTPLDFQNEIAHYYRFEEVYKNRIIARKPDGKGHVWGETLGVDWSQVYPAIADPETHDFSNEPAAAQQAQSDCNKAFKSMVDELAHAFNGMPGSLGLAVQAMFDLKMAAYRAFVTPLSNGKVAGPAFLYKEN